MLAIVAKFSSDPRSSMCRETFHFVVFQMQCTNAFKKCALRFRPIIYQLIRFCIITINAYVIAYLGSICHISPPIACAEYNMPSQSIVSPSATHMGTVPFSAKSNTTRSLPKKFFNWIVWTRIRILQSVQFKCIASIYIRHQFSDSSPFQQYLMHTSLDSSISFSSHWTLVHLKSWHDSKLFSNHFALNTDKKRNSLVCKSCKGSRSVCHHRNDPLDPLCRRPCGSLDMWDNSQYQTPSE